jgi:hypothetical protein
VGLQLSPSAPRKVGETGAAAKCLAAPLQHAVLFDYPGVALRLRVSGDTTAVVVRVEEMTKQRYMVSENGVVVLRLTTQVGYHTYRVVLPRANDSSPTPQRHVERARTIEFYKITEVRGVVALASGRARLSCA